MRSPKGGMTKLMLTRVLHETGFRGWQFHLLSLGSIALCIVLWIRAKTLDQEERPNAERRALFAGLWPPTLWLVGDSLQRTEAEAGTRASRRLRRFKA